MCPSISFFSRRGVHSHDRRWADSPSMRTRDHGQQSAGGTKAGSLPRSCLTLEQCVLESSAKSRGSTRSYTNGTLRPTIRHLRRLAQSHCCARRISGCEWLPWQRSEQQVLPAASTRGFETTSAQPSFLSRNVFYSSGASLSSARCEMMNDESMVPSSMAAFPAAIHPVGKISERKSTSSSSRSLSIFSGPTSANGTRRCSA